MNISKFVSDLEGILTSVSSPFQVRSKSVPKNGTYIGVTRDSLGNYFWGTISTFMGIKALFYQILSYMWYFFCNFALAN